MIASIGFCGALVGSYILITAWVVIDVLRGKV